MIATNSLYRQGNSTTPKLELNASRQFTSWLHSQHLSLAFSTYQGGKIFFIGLQPSGKMSVFERSFERCMGLHATENTIWLSSLYQLWRLENILEPGQQQDGYDCLYVPQMSYITGDLDIHDLAVGDCPKGLTSLRFASETRRLGEGKITNQPIFVNTLFSCLATVSPTHSFVPLWKPPFISRLAAEDRCHLNGMAIVLTTSSLVHLLPILTIKLIRDRVM